MIGWSSIQPVLSDGFLLFMLITAVRNWIAGMILHKSKETFSSVIVFHVKHLAWLPLFTIKNQNKTDNQLTGNNNSAAKDCWCKLKLSHCNTESKANNISTSTIKAVKSCRKPGNWIWSGVFIATLPEGLLLSRIQRRNSWNQYEKNQQRFIRTC